MFLHLRQISLADNKIWQCIVFSILFGIFPDLKGNLCKHLWHFIIIWDILKLFLWGFIGGFVWGAFDRLSEMLEGF